MHSEIQNDKKSSKNTKPHPAVERPLLKFQNVRYSYTVEMTRPRQAFYITVGEFHLQEM